MLTIDVKDGNVERALKEFKRKVMKTRLVQELRERQSYTKKSVKRREEIIKAQYRETLKDNT
jgi:small subunit ribosomal protein S21